LKPPPLFLAVPHRYKRHRLEYRVVVNVRGARWKIEDVWLVLLDGKAVKKNDEKKQLRAMKVWVDDIEDSVAWLEMVDKEVAWQKKQGVNP